MQSPYFLTYYIVFVIILFCVSLAISLAIRFGSTYSLEGKTGSFAGWWRWINRKDPSIQTSRTMPDSMSNRSLESLLCPNCGSTLSTRNVQDLEYGYDVKCEYCGATINSPRMKY